MQNSYRRTVFTEIVQEFSLKLCIWVISVFLFALGGYWVLESGWGGVGKGKAEEGGEAKGKEERGDGANYLFQLSS